ncbi:hypothetical protein [Pelosinus propionicus]|uniref:Uncharacterized protein n=1 Tax=Pelosinus propionicus DSM 13327 TaxID=1123291 RepID=A0A1I4N328_9FIRM|nr:hypothetical protein [Pelosinus propionicus]SFM09746.1 hypothetical protein SAMN04490355_104063 [Pelosinus propionicus DSM 13327]
MSWKVFLLNSPVNYEDISKSRTGDNLKPIGLINTKPKISDNLQINNKIYHVCMLVFEEKYIGVREISFVDEDEVDETVEENFTCPYCQYIDPDAFELEDEGERNCPGCGSEIKYIRRVSVEYVVEPVKRAKIWRSDK